MREFVQKSFLSLLGVFLLVVFLKNEHYLNFLFIHFLIEINIYILIIMFIVWVVKKLNKWMSALRYKLSIEMMASLFIIIFFTYELFTPYFYPEDYLKKVGLEKIEVLHQLTNPELTNKERDSLAKDAVVKEMAASFSMIGHYPNVGLNDQGEVIDFRRHFNRYELIIESDPPELKKFQYIFSKEGMDFKIIGFGEFH
ncbi:hypothetical protein RGU12_21700 [Fredinandcohnia sp. QZ13]|uniref:hypothetical protein n=1 Tax=Fredinandcohnia sp. QZ13 TaxID=3073144 RepID=UPI0028534BD0|nr:hypothetical protein [Fredinandcohnia sp. QZ13]MDR4890116.1 hypothetical protein [Fredinandcohnia sp. QZ13]